MLASKGLGFARVFGAQKSEEVKAVIELDGLPNARPSGKGAFCVSPFHVEPAAVGLDNYNPPRDSMPCDLRVELVLDTRGIDETP